MKRTSRFLCFCFLFVWCMAYFYMGVMVMMADEINEIKENMIKIEAGMFKPNEQNEKPYRTFPSWDGTSMLSVKVAGFDQGDILGFVLKSELAANANRWIVKKESIIYPEGMRLVRPHSQDISFKTIESIRFEIPLDKKIEGTVSWVLQHNGFEDKKIEIPILIEPKMEPGQMRNDAQGQTKPIEGQKEDVNDVKVLKEKIREYEGKMDEYKKKNNELEERVTQLKKENKSLQGDKGKGRGSEGQEKKEYNNIVIACLSVIISWVGFISFRHLGRKLKEKFGRRPQNRTGKDFPGMNKKGNNAKEKSNLASDNDRKPGPRRKSEEPRNKDSKKEWGFGSSPKNREEDEPEFSFTPRSKDYQPVSGDDYYLEARSEEDYFPVNLRKIWKYTAVYEVLFKRTCVVEMDICVTRSYEAERIPETAGFLLGRYSSREGNGGKIFYNVLCEVFIPALHIKCTETEVEFQAETFRDLAIQKDKYPGLELVGWFHTHPGWGVFLSNLDKDIHEKHFNRPWQIAVVVESSDANKIGIFSWDTNERLNYTAGEVDNKEFISWDEFKRWLRKRRGMKFNF